MDRQVDRAALVPVEPVGAGSRPDHRLFAEAVDRDPPEVAAAGPAEVREVRSGLVRGTATSELVNWSQARPPIGDRDGDRDHRAEHRGHRPQHRRMAGELERPPGQPALAPLERRSPANSAVASAIPASRISRTVTPWSTAAWLATLSARLSRAWTASTAGSAPIAPIASVASSQSRSRERAIRIPAEIDERQQAAARVGEVEGEEDSGDRRDREPAQRRPGRPAAHPEQGRDGDPEHRPVGVPVFERVVEPRPFAERADVEDVGQEAASQSQKRDNERMRSQALQRIVDAFRSVWAIRKAAR